MCGNNLPKVATQWNSGTTREWNPGHRARTPSALTTKPLSHMSVCVCDVCLQKFAGIRYPQTDKRELVVEFYFQSQFS